MKVLDFNVTAPSGLFFEKENPFSQLEDRIKNGFNNLSVIIKESYSIEQRKQFISFLNSKPDVSLSFDMGGVYGNKPEKVYQDIISTVEQLSSVSDQIKKTLSMKFPSIVKPEQIVFNEENPRSNANSPINLETYKRELEENIGIMSRLSEMTYREGMQLEVENAPTPDYLNLSNAKVLVPDPHLRWGGLWSTRPNFMGLPFSNAQEILSMVGDLQNCALQLDIEHLIQTCEWGNTYNLELATSGILRYGDLDSSRKENLRRSNGFSCVDEDVLFDYSNLKDFEETFLEKFGYIVREGQPTVYADQLTLRGELEKLLPMEISLVTPGFQVERGFLDFFNGEEFLTIGSHMPGIHEKYIPSKAVRERISDQLATVYKAAYDFMKKKEITDIEYAPQGQDSKGIVYQGSVWAQEAEIALDQQRSFFKAARDGTTDMSKAPHFL